MASLASRPRASSSMSLEAGVTDLQSHFRDFTIANPNIESEERKENVQQLQLHINAGHCIKQSLLGSSNPGRARDAFRHINGFQIVLSNIEYVSRSFMSQIEKSEEVSSLLNLLQITFGVLNAALQDHKGNQKYFRQRVEGGGWVNLRGLLEQMLQYAARNIPATLEAIVERIFGCLLSCATNDEMLIGFFGNLRRLSLNNLSQYITVDGSKEDMTRPSEFSSKKEDKAILTSFLIATIERRLDKSITLQSPDSMTIMLELWKILEDLSVEGSNLEGLSNNVISSAVPSILSHCASLSTHNLLAIHGTGLLNTVLSYLLVPSLSSAHMPRLLGLASKLLELGLTTLDDAYFLFRNARTSPVIANLLLTGLDMYHTPPYVHFDLSLHGFASIELPAIGREFPPISSSMGYTLCLWAYFVNFDANAHTTLFGAFDSSQTCFVLVYLEKDTHNLILQTSVTSSRPSVRFKSMPFLEGRWYHISIVHRRPKTTTSSRASLFIDGEFVEQVKSNYPSSPPLIPSVTQKTEPNSNSVQAFLGTPQDLASKLGRGLISSQWRLASAHVFGDVLGDDLIAVYHQLGPRYSGNYQDCLGSFQTYQASAALNLRNESLHPGKEERSDIISAIRSKASILLPEIKVLLNISPTVVLDDNDHNNIDEKQLVKSLSNSSIKNLRNVTRGGRNALAINGSVPSINEALLHSFGFAVLTGDPAVVVPQSLDDAAWRVGGCAGVGLALFEAAHSHDDIIRALNILFKSVQESWRNSEAMERENGFGVLANLIAAKLDCQNSSNINEAESSVKNNDYNTSRELLSIKILKLILDFLGYRAEKPEDSVINNPLAYRILLVDFDTWRTNTPSVQKLYYEQFEVFSVNSKYHQFNTKRLSRMRQRRPAQLLLLC